MEVYHSQTGTLPLPPRTLLSLASLRRTTPGCTPWTRSWWPSSSCPRWVSCWGPCALGCFSIAHVRTAGSPRDHRRPLKITTSNCTTGSSTRSSSTNNAAARRHEGIKNRVFENRTLQLWNWRNFGNLLIGLRNTKTFYYLVRQANDLKMGTSQLKLQLWKHTRKSGHFVETFYNNSWIDISPWTDKPISEKLCSSSIINKPIQTSFENICGKERLLDDWELK